MRTVTTTTLAVLVVLSAMAVADEKRPVPDAAAQKKVNEIIDSVYGEQFRGKSSASARSLLAKEVLKAGQESGEEPVEAYVLFRVARDVAAGAGDVDTALEAVREIDNAFKVDADEMLLVVIQKSAKAKTSPAARKHLAQVASQLAGEAIGNGRFESAKKMIASALVAARASRDQKTIAKVTRRSREIAQLTAEYGKVKEALATIGKTPDDPEASLRAGKFFCFIVGNWQRGLPLLAAGANADLRTTAKLDASAPVDPKERLKLADQWWKLGQVLTGVAQNNVMQRAAHWYGKSMEGATLRGLARKKAESRIAKFAKIAAENDLPRPRTGKGTKGRTRGKPSFEVVSRFKTAPATIAASLSADGKVLMLIDGSRTSRLYNTTFGQPLKHDLHEKGGVAGGRFTFVKDVVVSAPWEGGCTLWNLRTGQKVGGPRCWQTKTVACAPNGKWMAVGQFRGKVGVVDIQNGQAVVSISAFSRNSPVEGLAFSQDSRFLAMVTRHGAGKVYQLPDGVQSADLGSGLRTALAFTPDGRLLVASQTGGAIQVRSPKTGQRLGVWQGHSNTVRGIGASPDGFVVTASSDTTARIWQATDGRSQIIWKHNAPLAAVGFSPDYQHFAVVGEDGAVQVWKVTR